MSLVFLKMGNPKLESKLWRESTNQDGSWIQWKKKTSNCCGFGPLMPCLALLPEELLSDQVTQCHRSHGHSSRADGDDWSPNQWLCHIKNHRKINYKWRVLEVLGNDDQLWDFGAFSDKTIRFIHSFGNVRKTWRIESKNMGFTKDTTQTNGHHQLVNRWS